MEHQVAALEDQPQLLAVEAARLVEAVIEVEMHAVVVADRALDLVFAAVGFAAAGLGGGDLAGAEPAGHQVEEVDAVLDEDAAALFAVPEPMLGGQVFVGGVVFKVAVQHGPERLSVDEAADDAEQVVVALHLVGDQEAILPASEGDQFVGFVDGEGERLFANDVLAGGQRLTGLLEVQKRRRGDVHQLDARQTEQAIDFHDVFQAVSLGGGAGGGPGGAGHACQPDAGHLDELLQREQPKAAATDDAEANFVLGMGHCLLVRWPYAAPDGRQAMIRDLRAEGESIVRSGCASCPRYGQTP